MIYFCYCYIKYHTSSEGYCVHTPSLYPYHHVLLCYRLFTHTQYFDSTGFFIFVVLAGPIIFNCFIIIVSSINISLITLITLIITLSCKLFPLRSMQISWLHLAWKLMMKVAVLKRKATERRNTKQDRKQAKKIQ